MIFYTDQNIKKLPVEKSEVCSLSDSKTATVWVVQRARSDVRTPASFLCSRVKNLKIEDQKKLRRGLKFLTNQIISDTRIIGANGLDVTTC